MSENVAKSALGERPELDERAVYVARARQERFIVGNLAKAVPELIGAFAPGEGTALDVGCGRQPFRALLTARGIGYVGLDTQQNIDRTVDVVCPIDGPVPDELVAKGPFSFVLCTEVLEHVADWSTAFENIAGLLGPGGRVLITCPHVYPLHEEPYDFWRPTIYALRYFAAKNGLRVIKELRLGDGWDVLGTLLASGRPKVAKGSMNPIAYVVAGIAAFLRAGLLWLAKGSIVRRLTPMAGTWYLSNIVVLEKPR